MVVAMLGFAIEDMLIKQLSAALPVGQILWIIGGGGALLFGGFAYWKEGPGLFSALLLPRVLLRNAFEAIGAIGFVTALALIPLSTASAILQAAPLIVTLGAALFLGEPVGWRRWMAIVAGMCGVLLILRPGFDGFDPMALFAVLGVCALGGRDVVTRAMPAGISSIKLALYAFVTMVPTGVAMMVFQGQPHVIPGPADSLRLVGTVLLGIAAYYAIVSATRIGEMSAVAPFRYTRLVFALILGALVFGERPDPLTLLGSAIIIASGLYTLWREARHRQPSPPPEALL